MIRQPAPSVLLHTLLAVLLLCVPAPFSHAGDGSSAGKAGAGKITIAAASDLRFALDEVVENFRRQHPRAQVEVVYGSSGKFLAQIANGAPFDLYFSADIAYPRELANRGLAGSEVRPYATGRLVLWSLDPRLANTPLAEFPNKKIRKFAIANPQHAPYGMRAQEALQHQGVWQALEPKLVFGENIAHAAQFVDSGAADAGIVALSLVLSPAMKGKGAWTLVPADWHEPLEQGFVITRRARDNALAQVFADHMGTEPARAVLRRYGFLLPGGQGGGN
ncbi:MAG: molybdate ABC transporter substrate-binding protein [Gammaproteobacteria bacterium]